MKLFKFIKNLFMKPSAKIGLGILVTLGFIAGAISWQSFNDVMDSTSTEEFCVSCHSMEQPLAELKETVHWSNSSGVTATCSNCHLPHEKTPKFARKVQAMREVFAEFTGKYDEEGSFEEHRQEMAEREWARFAANGSKECKTCHSYERMDFDNMSDLAKKAMIPAAERDQSCMDCHKGIAHHLPEMKASKGSASKFDNLVVSSLSADKTYFTKANVKLFNDEAMSSNIGQLETAVPVTFVKSGKDADLVELTMWRKNKGFGRIWYHQFGKNITDAVLSKEFMQTEPKFEVIATQEDPLTGLTWQNVKMQVWVPKASLIEDIKPIWADAENTYKTQCSTCHRQPEVAHFDSNTWIGLFNGMVGFTNIDKQTGKEVLRYLQLHSSDFEQHAE
ncbi:pentaheme c-type cytochrome TorC [Otariodibacter oris]|uniref:Cytochrome c-type protein n=1 Tax=Otariodibacter oris TaxID=1032623 RepID=A0A420XG16_9PAST|nr:pentaheme c-type cytochrome TorC [Otariodibacter oris]QGM79956.1 nitrate reductase [Otariodibacter oris]RKR71777.1 trimethylamine-N-oxide reductase cytochrome c-type subunit TorC [Otariodibacter oris]